MTVFAGTSETPGCCGVIQIHHMGSYELDHDDADCAYEAKTWAELLAKLVDNETKGIVLQVWFRDRVNWDGESSGRYDAGDLRELVRNIPGVVSLGEFRNPNTNNIIDGYQWVNV